MAVNSSRRDQRRQLRARSFLFALCLAIPLCAARASIAQPAAAKVQTLFVSDVHFDPFWDPGKAARLAARPEREWRSILEAAPSPDREQRFAALQQSCHMRGTDTSYPLLASALAQMRAHAAEARFVTVSGDLMAHQFDCKYKALFPQASPEDYRTFVEKTIAFVIAELDGVAPNARVYVALGNNDSDCGDYQLDDGGPFLADIAPRVLRSVPERQHAEAMESFKQGGYYSVMLPAPVEHTRLLVLNDVFLSPWHANCAGKPDAAAGDAELAWLAQQLDKARAAKEHVWVMGHIPPGVDAYSTLSHGVKCPANPPVMFLATDKLAQELTGAGDEIRLGIFAHAHTDEIKLLEPEAQIASGAASDAGTGGRGKAAAAAVAVKMVSSISPINGNNPSFTIAEVNPATAELADYRVFAASNQTGTGEWAELYDFDRVYGEKSFSTEAVRRVLGEFAADRAAKSAASQNYVHDFLTGRPDILLPLVWPQYVCTLSHATASGYADCACPAAQKSPAAPQ
jgi:sphingomyelin phosphodiesterase acid-like 3